MTGRAIGVWKFLIPADESRPLLPPHERLSMSGCLAIVIAASREEAMQIAREKMGGGPASAWVEVADCICYDATTPRLVGLSLS